MKNKTWYQMEKIVNKDTVALLPVGSVEQHGLHAPLGTDLIIAQSLAATQIENENAVVAPAVPVGVSEYHRHFSGSLWVSPEVLKLYVGDIIKSFLFHGIKKVVIVNGHGGNMGPLKELGRFLDMKYNTRIVVWTWFEAIEEKIIKMYGERPPLHADEAETSMLMAVAPELVINENLKKSADGASKKWGSFFKGTMICLDVYKFSKTGATGNPAKANNKDGLKLLSYAKEDLKQLINYVVSQEI